MFHFRHRHRGFDAGFGPSHHGFRGGRQRGEMKYEILDVLTHGPSHGYDIMLAIESKTGMRPSAGSIYPALQMLEDGDFIKGADRDGKRTFEITEKGRELFDERERTKSSSSEDCDMQGFYGVIAEGMRQVHGIKDAVKQVARSGNVELYKKALPILDRARRELYALLSEHF